MKVKNILLVEDDAVVASGLVYALEQEGHNLLHEPMHLWAWKKNR